MAVKLSAQQIPAAMLVVAAALVDNRGRVLLQQRPLAREHGGLWEFPGGKVEPGEGPAAALARELHEELALILSTDVLVPLGFAASEPGKGTRSIVLLLYGCREWCGSPDSQEGATWLWYEPEQLADLAMPPLDVPLARLACAFAGSAK